MVTQWCVKFPVMTAGPNAMMGFIDAPVYDIWKSDQPLRHVLVEKFPTFNGWITTLLIGRFHEWMVWRLASSDVPPPWCRQRRSSPRADPACYTQCLASCRSPPEWRSTCAGRLWPRSPGPGTDQALVLAGKAWTCCGATQELNWNRNMLVLYMILLASLIDHTATSQRSNWKISNRPPQTKTLHCSKSCIHQ